MNEKLEIYQKFFEKVQAKFCSLNIDDAPYSRAEADAYIEGWRSANMFAIDILAEILKNNTNHDRL